MEPPPVYLAFYFSPSFLRGIGVGPVLGFPSIVCVMVSHVHCAATEQVEGSAQRARQEGREQKGVVHSGSCPGLRGRQVGEGRGLTPAHRKVHIVQRCYVAFEDF